MLIKNYHMKNIQPKKLENIEKIEQIILLEKVGVPTYAKHIKESVNWSELSRGKIDLILGYVKMLEKNARLHSRMLNKLKNTYYV